jgi:hypothetical protein
LLLHFSTGLLRLSPATVRKVSGDGAPSTLNQEIGMSTPKSPKQVKVNAHGCTPSNLELYKGKDAVIFVKNGPDAPASIHLNDAALFGTTTCKVGATPEDATPYTAQSPGNFTIGTSPEAARQTEGKGTVKVLCLAFSGAMGAGDSGSIKVTR